MNPTALNALKSIGNPEENIPLSEYTTFKTGGPAELLFTVHQAGTVSKIIKTARQYAVPVTVIGGGSNLLVGDKGVEGVVVRIAGSGNGASVAAAESGVYCPASVSKSDLISFCIENGFGGIEFMAGIPGVVGGGVVMNAGTSMGNFSRIVDRIEAVDMSGNIETIKILPEKATYRDIGLGGDYAVTGVYLNLERASDPDSVKRSVYESIKERNKKHPVKFPSAGSVFKNPEGFSSWKLIRDCGLAGKRAGGAEVSSLHTNFIINSGGASSLDIKMLIDDIRETVMKKFRVKLETEIKMIGRF